MDEHECRRRFRLADHAYLGTVGADLAPHLVPVVVDLTGDQVAIAVDNKPKRTRALQRLRNIEQNPQVCLLADAYSRDWDALWWVRADGLAKVVADSALHDGAVRRLRARYPQYRETPPDGPVILIEVRRWTGWKARPTCP